MSDEYRSLSLKPHERYGFIYLCLDGEPWRTLATSIFGKSPTIPQEMAPNELDTWFRSFEKKNLQRYVLNRLSAKSYSSFELKKKIAQFEVSTLAAEEVLQIYISQGYLDDEEWLKNLIASESRKGKGIQWIRAKLYSKGVPRSTVEKVLSENAFNPAEKIKSLVEKISKGRSLKDPKEKRRVIGALVRRGFTFESINQALSLSEFEF